MSGSRTRVANVAVPRKRGSTTSRSGACGLPMTARSTGGSPCHFCVTILRSPSTSVSARPWPPPVEKSRTIGCVMILASPIEGSIRYVMAWPPRALPLDRRARDRHDGAQDQAGPVSRNLQDFKDGSYRFSASLESLESVRGVAPSFRCARTAEGILNRVEQSVHRDGLDQRVLRGNRLRASGHEDNRQCRAQLPQVVLQFGTAQARHYDIEQDAAGLALLRQP